MHSQLFDNYTHQLKPIKIRIDESAITFHYPSEGDREFYDISVADWKRDRSFWLKHMEQKMWFSDYMKDFIDKNIML